MRALSAASTLAPASSSSSTQRSERPSAAAAASGVRPPCARGAQQRATRQRMRATVSLLHTAARRATPLAPQSARDGTEAYAITAGCGIPAHTITGRTSVSSAPLSLLGLRPPQLPEAARSTRRGQPPRPRAAACAPPAAGAAGQRKGIKCHVSDIPAGWRGGRGAGPEVKARGSCCAERRGRGREGSARCRRRRGGRPAAAGPRGTRRGRRGRRRGAA